MASRDIEKLKEPFRSSIKKLIERAKAAGLPVLVTDVTRTVEEQRELVRKGYSKTMFSKHLTGEAVDIAFQINGKLSYDAGLYDKLYAIAKSLPYVIYPYIDLGWAWDRPHFQFDPAKKGSETNMSQVEELKNQVRRLHEEVRTLTSEVHEASAKAVDVEESLKRERASHKETIEKGQSTYQAWQEQIERANKLAEELKVCQESGNLTEEQRRALALLEQIRTLLSND